jgi:hypothetical protein
LAGGRWVRSTYREEDIAKVHHAQNHVADLGLVEGVAAEEQHAGEDVVGEHLPMVLAVLLNIHHEQLLHPETELYEIVPLHQSVQGSCGEVRPHGSEIEPVRRVVHDVLQGMLARLTEASHHVADAMRILTMPSIHEAA